MIVGGRGSVPVSMPQPRILFFLKTSSMNALSICQMKTLLSPGKLCARGVRTSGRLHISSKTVCLYSAMIVTHDGRNTHRQQKIIDIVMKSVFKKDWAPTPTP
ncbi:hypothetical protein L3Y34_011449 [Caenorhabditis briggsae]|uniref:Uncharacterized protein n=1 Tax=Caenorhabditis briggsae TaxID=6238 RepID=A0AAE9CUG6_CAEBR|nr:hypothetical protein L3Y34_011449 [Caenorhabditis briggsae]